MTISADRRAILRATGLIGIATLAGPSLAGCSTAAEKRISFLNWQDYIDPDLLREFTDKTGLEVGYETYASNDELERRLTAAAVTRKGGRKATSFDLIVPSANLFSRLMAADALRAFDDSIVTSTLTAELNPRLEQRADPDNRYSIPWAAGTTGIGYDTRVFAEPPTWEVFLDPQYAGRMSLLDETREAFAAALFLLGEDPNTTDPGVVAAAEKKLRAMLVNSSLNSATYLDGLAEGELVVAQGFNTDVLQAQARNPDLGYVVPEAGGTTWVDLLCIPTDAPNPDGANEFVAFYLDPEVSARNAEYNHVATGNLAARAAVDPALLADPAVYPPPAVEKVLVALRDLGDAEELYLQAWERLTKKS